MIKEKHKISILYDSDIKIVSTIASSARPVCNYFFTMKFYSPIFQKIDDEFRFVFMASNKSSHAE